MKNLRSYPEILVSFVVIGLNEADRLASSLAAIFNDCPHDLSFEVIYADSGSIDSSCEIAAAFDSVKVLRLTTNSPSAAKARNLGLRAARGSYVQLVDGDSILQPGWLEKALLIISQKPELACVFGHCIEEFPEQSIYMRVCSLDWHIKPGYHRLCGGNSLWRRSVLEKFGYFPEDLRYGEEPDLCYRVRQAGWKILCVDVPMVKHDLAMKTFFQYWRRGENSGKAYFSVSSRYYKNPEKMWLFETLRNFVEPVLWGLILVLGTAFSGIATGGALLIMFFVLRGLQIGLKVKKRANSWLTAIMYGLHAQFIRLPISIGQIKAALSR
jgi:glycosyltransferase involved in cell wall biosynthesis